MATPSGKPSRKSDLEGDERAWVESFGRSLRTDENANATASLNQHRAPGAFSTFIPVSNTTNFGWLGSSSTGLASPTDSSIPCPPVSAQARRASIPQQVIIIPYQNDHRSVNGHAMRKSLPAKNRDERPVKGPKKRDPPISVHFTPSIFYNVKQNVLSLTRLNLGETANPRLVTNILPLNVPVTILYRNRDDPYPRYELQMRMALDDEAGGQLDQFPEALEVLLNNQKVTLPPFVKASQSASAHGNPKKKRAPQPIDLTPCCDFQNNKQMLTIDWNAHESGEKRFVFGIWVVEHVNSEMLCDRLLANMMKKRMTMETQILIAKGYQDSDVIEMDNQKVSLVCPTTSKPMKFPCYSQKCVHFQCFDALNFLQTNEKQPNWKCPVCSEPATYESLMLDEYFVEVINKVGGRVQEVELLPNGKWMEVPTDRKRSAVESIDDNDEHPKKKSGVYSVNRNNGEREDISTEQSNVAQNLRRRTIESIILDD